METNLLTAIKEDAVDAVIINEDAPRKTSFIEANTEEVTFLPIFAVESTDANGLIIVISYEL